MKEMLNELLMEDKTMIHMPFGNGLFDIYASVIVTWIFMAVIIILVLFLTRDLKVHNISKRQAALEYIVVTLRNIFGNILGEKGAGYTDYMVSVLIFIFVANMVGIFGFTPPTMDLSVTIALALMSIVLVQVSGIHKKGTGGWIKSFGQPMLAVFPMNILELGIKPLSLCMRLFGNVLGATIIMELIKHLTVVNFVLPAFLSIYFDLFDGAIQAYVFCFLTSLYISEAVE